MRALCLLLAASAAVHAQGAEPMACWWRTSAGAVAVGEPFDVALTCSAREDRDARVLIDETRLAPEAIQLAPYEVVGGSHPADVRRDDRRLFQYRYRVRIIDPDVIGKDTPLPDVRVPYRVESLDNGTDRIEGREREYVLQGLRIRVLSLVPLDATDIREPGEADFAQAETLRFRARALRVTSFALGALGIILLVPAAARVARRGSMSAATTGHRLSRRAIWRQTLGALQVIREESRRGWSEDLAHRALTAFRIVAACAVNGAISQRLDESSSPGRLALRHGWLRPRMISVGSPLTARDLDASAMTDLRNVIAAFTAAIYGTAFSPEALDDAFDRGLAAARQVKVRR